MENSHEAISAGKVIAGRYAIRHLLGSGDIGSVYLASDKEFGGELVAIRILHNQHSKDQATIEHFLSQVEMLRNVEHPNLVQIFDGGSDGGIVYFTMEFVNGESLSNMIYDGVPPEPLDIDRIGWFAEQMAAGLTALHAANTLHLELKTQDILVLDDDTVKITGFGPDQSPDFHLTDRSKTLLSHHYLAPEVWFGQRLTPAADLYSVGVILYEASTGQLPFSEENPDRLMNAHVKSVVKSPRSVRPDLPPWLNLIILGLMQKSPAGRPKSASDLATFLEANRGNRSQFTRMPEVAGQLEFTRPVTLTLSSQTVALEMAKAEQQPAIKVGGPVLGNRAKRRKQAAMAIVAAAIAVLAVLFNSSEICACTTVQQLLTSTLDLPAKGKFNASIISTKLEKYISKGTPKMLAQKKLSALAGTHSDWCSAAVKEEYRCRFPLQAGFIRTRTVTIVLEFKGSDADRLSSITVQDFHKFLWIRFTTDS